MFAGPKTIQQLLTTASVVLRSSFATARKRRVRGLGEEKVSLHVDSEASPDVPQTSNFYM
jgi:hypothetical protein